MLRCGNCRADLRRSRVVEGSSSELDLYLIRRGCGGLSGWSRRTHLVARPRPRTHTFYRWMHPESAIGLCGALGCRGDIWPTTLECRMVNLANWSMPNNALERTVRHCGPRLAAARSSWAAAQRGRQPAKNRRPVWQRRPHDRLRQAAFLGVVNGRNVLITGSSTGDRHPRAHVLQVLDLIAEDSWRNVYAGELQVSPPGARTIPSSAAYRIDLHWATFKESSATRAKRRIGTERHLERTRGC